MGSDRARKLPVSSDTSVRVAPVSRSFTVKATPFIPAPDESSIFPEMAAVTWLAAD
jgi:hypothetical protein